jgi:hypothetical protein
MTIDIQKALQTAIGKISVKESDLQPEIRSLFKLVITDGETWMVDLREKPEIRQADEPDAECTIELSTEVLGKVMSDPGSAWTLADGMHISVTEIYRGAVFLELMFPGTLEKSMPPNRFKALFPRSSPQASKAATATEFFEKVLPEKLKTNPGMLRSVTAAYQFDIVGEGVWTLDMTADGEVYAGPAKRKGSVITLPKETFARVLEDDAMAWPLYNAGDIKVSDPCRAAQVVQALWPRAFAKGMPPRLYRSVFREPSEHVHTQTKGVYTTYLRGKDGHPYPVQYGVHEGLALFQGDIVLGKADEMEAIRKQVEGGGSPSGLKGCITKGNIWLEGIIYYDFQGNDDTKKAFKAAADVWTARTRITFQEYKSGPDVVSVHLGDTNSSPVGRIGGMQELTYTGIPSTGTFLHEIGHAVGLWHEHSRDDRDTYVTIHQDNIKPEDLYNFDKVGTDKETDYGNYDYDSIMHYGVYEFSKNSLSTITANNGAAIGQRDHLSSGDIAAVNHLYGW